jgi:hypothetical protein
MGGLLLEVRRGTIKFLIFNREFVARKKEIISSGNSDLV